jgi:hypothetical protein
MIYRRQKGQLHRVWHFNSEYSQWPLVNYVQIVAAGIQKDEVLCSECVMSRDAKAPRTNQQYDAK